VNVRRLGQLGLSIAMAVFVVAGTPLAAQDTGEDPRPPPSSTAQQFQASNAPGYCSSSGGSTEYERIETVSFTRKSSGVFKLVVDVFIANPTNCQPGEDCPEYDNSPEYVNVWIDWNGDETWDPSEERVMDAALTGYLNINYQGSMTAVTQFTPPNDASLTDDPTWLRANLGWSYDPNNPCEESWTWGNVVDKQIHLEAPEITSISVEGVETHGSEPTTDNTVRLEADMDVPSDYQITKCEWSGGLRNGDGNPGNNCRYEYTPGADPGPQGGANGYGEKKATLNITYEHQPSGAMGNDSQDKKYNVFFDKGEGPGSWTDDDGDGEPNWFEYWGEDNAVPELTAGDVNYDQTLGANSYGYWDSGDGNIHVGGAAAQTHYSGGLNVPGNANCPGGNFGDVDGIDAASEVLVHERRHETIHENWDAGGAWHPPADHADSDDPNHPTKHDDQPADDLPDSYENGTLKTDPNDVDACDLATHKSPTYSDYGDNEFDAMEQSDGAQGTDDNDWANPGKRTTPPFSPPIAADGSGSTSLASNTSRLVSPDGAQPSRKSGRAGPNAPYVGPTYLLSTGGELAGTYTDTGMDSNGNGLFEHLRLNVEVQIQNEGLYNVVAWLEGESGTEIAFANTQQTLASGTSTVELLFDGSLIRSRGMDGPYSVSRVELRATDEENLVDEAEDVHTTAGYQATDFEPSAVEIADDFSDTGIDEDGDGQFDWLRTQIDLQVHEASTYSIIAALKSSSDSSTTIDVVNRTVSLSSGTQTVDLDFDGRTIFQHRKDGPYYLARLRIRDDSGSQIAFASDVLTTSSYDVTQFQSGVAILDASAFSDEGWDPDEDGDFDYLRVEVKVDADQAGSFRLSADLDDGEGEGITSVEKTLDLEAGSQTVVLNFPGSQIRQHEMDGPYRVSRVTLFAPDGEVADYQQLGHTTQPYSTSDFGEPLVSLTDTYQDYGRDTDGDGFFDELVIEVEVMPNSDGVVVANGRLVDGNGDEIEVASNNVEMTAENPQVVPLVFSGEEIRIDGQEGPYQLRDLVVYNTADPNQEVTATAAHTTETYSTVEFDLPANVDLGDAPDDSSASQYPTLASNDGTAHLIQQGMQLGTSIDAEPNGQPDADATGDDTDSQGDDEDGISGLDTLRAGQTVQITVSASAAGKLDAWADWNQNHDWQDAGEQIFANEGLSSGENALSVSIPSAASGGQTFFRFRFSSAGGLSPTGLATDGEVEDYQVLLLVPPGDLEGNASDSQVDLSWSSVGAGDPQEYYIYRNTTPFDPSTGPSGYTPYDSTAVGSTTYTDTDAISGATYYYRVTTVYEGGVESGLSTETSVFLYPQDVNADVSRSFGGASGPGDYQLVALPGDVDRPLSETVSGESGTTWQAWWDDGSAENYLIKFDRSETFRLGAGRGFWLTSTQQWSVQEAFPTVDLRGDSAAVIGLHEGWNIVSNPTGKDVTWGRVSAENGGTLQPLWAFDGSFAQVDTFRSARSGIAYYFHNEDGLDSLAVPYPGAPAELDGKRRAEKAPPLQAFSLAAKEASGHVHSSVCLGVAEGAKPGKDPLDLFAPPSRFSKVSLRVQAPRTAQQQLPSRQHHWARDVRPLNADGHRYRLRLRGAPGLTVHLSPVGLEGLADRQAVLLDPSRGQSRDLRPGESVALTLRDSTRAFGVALGSGAYVQDQKKTVLPDEVTLNSYPNPLRQRGTLVYTLPEASDVRLAVYDVLGRQVAVLISATRNAGRHRIQFSASQLSNLPSGVYFGRLRTETRTLTHKITVVR